MQQYFEDFIEDLRETHGENLVSVILYGSAVTGDFVPFRSDYNLLITLGKMAPSDLRDAHACMREWTKLGHPVPVYFTVGELEKAGDVFPIEFHFMERARKVLFGPDVLAGLEISDRNLRHQVEYELRSNLIRLRRKYIGASTSAASLLELMEGSLKSFGAVFRAVLLIYGKEPPNSLAEIMDDTAQALKIESGPFEKILVFRENDNYRKMELNEANEVFAAYLELLECAIDAVDAGT